jgi:hypothetical protein
LASGLPTNQLLVVELLAMANSHEQTFDNTQCTAKN